MSSCPTSGIPAGRARPKAGSWARSSGSWVRTWGFPRLRQQPPSTDLRALAIAAGPPPSQSWGGDEQAWMITRRNLVWGGSLAAAFAAGLGARPALASPSVLPAALADFFAPAETRGAALSPAGTRIALHKQTRNRGRIASRIDVIDASQPQQVLTRIGLGGLELESVAVGVEVRCGAHQQ